MKTSDNGLNLIKNSEGLRLSLYVDAVGKKTIGYGHLVLPNENFSSPIDITTALKLLQNDVKMAENHVNALNLTLTQNQFDALISFTFNLGNGPLVMMMHHGIDKVPVQILKWVYGKVNGVETVLPGLVVRRKAELALWQKLA